MGLFHHKKTAQKKPSDPDEEAAKSEAHFFDEYYREELRNRGRLYFERVINENGTLFKEDLDTTIQQINIELKDHVTKQLDAAIVEVNADLKQHVMKQLDDQFAQHQQKMKAAQDTALQAMAESAQALLAQHKQISDALQKQIADQAALLDAMSQESKTQITTMNESQAAVLEWLKGTVKNMQEHHRQLAATLQERAVVQETLLVDTFAANMTQVVEHYLLEALGDQYDLKAQLPSIIKQMETNKQAIVDDMKL